MTRKALITGSDGFVGRHFTKFLKDLDWEVYGLDIATDADEDAIRYCLSNSDEWFNLIIHCAYEVGGRAHIDGVNMALAHNVMLDAALFDWALLNKQGAVLYFSSSAAYPTPYQNRHNAGTLLNEDLIDDRLVAPDSNYGWAKLTGERIAKAAMDQGLRVNIVRPFSGYAGDQSLDYPFPSIVKRAARGDLTVWGPPGQTRDWIHIDDVVRGAYSVYENMAPHPVNLCTGIATEMGELALTINRMANPDQDVYWPVTYLEDKPTGVFYRVGDPTRMLSYYEPKIDIQRGIEEALENLRG